MFGSIGTQNLVDEPDTRWLLDTFAWCLRCFDSVFFFEETVLVVPDNEHFPGRADSATAMAELIFDHVQRYAGMKNWPFCIADDTACTAVAVSLPEAHRVARRSSTAIATADANPSDRIPLTYDQNLATNPEALIASFAHSLAHYLGQTAQEPPPGGSLYWPQATEVVAIFMGFGLMFANSAFSVPVRACGSCAPQAQRRSFLTQYESTYALAIFSSLKQVPHKAVVKHLKKHLRSFYRACVRELEKRQVDPDSGFSLRSLQNSGTQTAQADPSNDARRQET